GHLRHDVRALASCARPLRDREQAATAGAPGTRWPRPDCAQRRTHPHPTMGAPGSGDHMGTHVGGTSLPLGAGAAAGARSRAGVRHPAGRSRRETRAARRRSLRHQPNLSRLDSRRSGRSDARSRPHQRGGGTASVASERGVSGGRFLPPDPSVEQPYLFTPTMAFRLAILAGIALLVFGVLTLRLWSLQILSGDKYRQAALENQDRLVRIEPPRGTILDRNGRPLVQNVASTSVQIWPADLPKDRAVREAELLELSRTLRLPVADINRAIRARGRDILTPVVVRRSVHPEQIAYLLERGRQFPGVQLKDAYIRRYPWQAMAAQVLGHVGEISADQLKARRRDGYQP